MGRMKVNTKSTWKRFVLREFRRYFCIILLPLLLLEPIFLSIVYKEIKENIVAENQSLPGQLENVLTDMWQNVNSINAYFSQNSNIGDTARTILKKRALNADIMDSVDAINSYLQNIQNMDSSVYSIYIYYNNDYGRFFDSRTSISKMNGFYDNSWYTEYLNSDEEFWCYRHSIRMYDFSEEVPVITACRKLHSGREGESDGLVVVNYRADELENDMSDLALYKNQSIVMLDEDGEVLLQSRDMDLDGLLTHIMSASGSFEDARREGFRNMEGMPTITEKVGDDNYVITVMPLDDYKITAVSLIPFGELYGQMQMIMYIMGMAFLAALILSMVLAWMSARRDVRRLNEVIALLNHELEPGQLRNRKKSERESVYDYILFNILQLFMEKDYLKVQYSERKYRMEMLMLQVLQHQINPHFMNNTLNSIYWEAIRLSGGPNRCTKMLKGLTSIMKYSMESKETEVTILEEKNYLNIYMDMQNERYGGKLELLWDVDIEAYTALIPKMLLQPLIENAIYHGIKEKGMHGRMKCRIQKNEEYLNFSILDTGMGVTKEKEKEICSHLKEREGVENHVGLYNTNLRLVLRYGEDASISFRSKYQCGSLLRFRIPYSDS